MNNDNVKKRKVKVEQVKKNVKAMTKEEIILKRNEKNLKK